VRELTFSQQQLTGDLADEIAAGEEGGKEIELVAVELQVFFHAGDVGIGCETLLAKSLFSPNHRLHLQCPKVI